LGVAHEIEAVALLVVLYECEAGVAVLRVALEVDRAALAADGAGLFREGGVRLCAGAEGETGEVGAALGKWAAPVV